MIIKLKNLRAETIIGVYAEERRAPRTLTINISISYDASRAAKSDNLADAIDYAEVEQKIVQSLAAQSFALLESLAEHIACLVLEFGGVKEVAVEIDKPAVLKYSDCVSVIHTARK